MILDYIRNLIFNTGSPMVTRSARRPTGTALRNPANPHQAARIEAAAAKRATRADKLHHFSSRAAVRNPTICKLGRYGALESFRKNLYPTYIAK